MGLTAVVGEADEQAVERGLELMAHRAGGGKGTARAGSFALGLCRAGRAGKESVAPVLDSDIGLALDGLIPGQEPKELIGRLAERGPEGLEELTGSFAFVWASRDRVLAARDHLGEVPLYMMKEKGRTMFATEIKSLLAMGPGEIVPIFPGQAYDSAGGLTSFQKLEGPGPKISDEKQVLKDLDRMLADMVKKRLAPEGELGAFLSGGLDSSVVTAVIRRFVKKLPTFSVGVKNAPDLANAQEVALALDTDHHEKTISEDEIIERLPEIIYQLESYDRDLVRSSVPCFFASRLAAKRASVILTGEGSDELYCGYSHEQGYTSPAKLHSEIIRLLNGLHWIGLQRGDRMTAGSGLQVRLPFLDMKMVRMGLAVDASLKLVTKERMEKWLVRAAFEKTLPSGIIWRKKAQFDQGSGVADTMPRLAAGRVTKKEMDAFVKEAGDLAPRDEEEAWYYRIFRERYDLNRVRKTIGRWTTPPEA